MDKSEADGYKKKRHERAIPVFKPLTFKHATPNGSPLITSAKEAKEYLKSQGLVNELFSS